MNTALAFLTRHRERLGLDRLGVPTRLSSVVLTPRFQASRHVVFLLLPEGGRTPVLVAKVPRLVDTNVSLAREAASLQSVHALRPSGFPGVPRLVAFEPCGDRSILVETAITGAPMSPEVVRRERDTCCAVVSDWLLNLHTASAHDAGGAWFTHLVDQPLDWMASTFPATPDEAHLIERTRAALQPLATTALPFVCEHGDFSHPNLMRPTPDSLGVVDWELAQMHGVPVYDLFVFLTYVAFSLQRARTGDQQLEAFRAAFFAPGTWATRLASAYARRAGVPAEVLAPLFVLTWARYTITLLMRLADANPDAPGTLAAHDAAWVRTNRYYQLWRESLAHASRQAWFE